MNATLDCSTFHLLHYSFLQEFSKDLFILMCFIDAIIFFSATLGNILILIALKKSQSIHSPSKALLSSLAFSDLGVGIIVAPLHFALTLGVIQEDPLQYCALYQPTTMAGFIMASVSTLTSPAIALDRYLAFGLRIRYRQLVTLRRIVVLLSSLWGTGIFFAVSWTLGRNINRIVGAFSTVLCTTTTLYFYLRIFFGLRRQTAQIQQQSRLRTNRRNIFSIPAYKKTVKNMFLIYCVISICYMPYLLAQMLIFFVGLSSSSFLVISFAYILILLNSMLNPIVYCWRIRDLKRQVLRILSHFQPLRKNVRQPTNVRFRQVTGLSNLKTITV